MTHREQEVYEFIVEYRNHMGISPSIREICLGLGLRSTSSGKYYVDRLTAEGMLMPSMGRKRGFVPRAELEKLHVADSLNKANNAI